MKSDPVREGKRWPLQAEQDLKDSRYSLDGERFHLACFLSQQAAEKALKAFLYAKGEEKVFGHSVAELCEDVIAHDTNLKKIKKASVLDKNGLPGGVPYEMFDENDAEKAVGLASELIDAIKKEF